MQLKRKESRRVASPAWRCVHVVRAALLLAGCDELAWTHPAGRADFVGDALTCDEAGVHANNGDPEMMAALNVDCMKARGWKLLPR
jgi:hypothetical protein